jgi:hypothetical protein
VKLPRTIRLDPSDAFVFAAAAEPGEWAVSGSFLFWNRDAATLAGKERQAFRSGILGIASFGWSTLAVVTWATPDEVEEATDRLAHGLVAHMGAPSVAAARAAAEEEIAFAASLCDHDVNTILAVQRSVEAGEVRERFRTLHKRDDIMTPTRVFEIVEDDEEGPVEEVDLSRLSQGKA